MRVFLVLSVILWRLHDTTAVTHSLQYFYTASSGVPNFPEFVNLGMLDGEQMDYYDSNIKKVIPKQDWMAKNVGPEYWDRQTQISIADEPSFKVDIETVKSRFNQTGGVHVFQYMYGCEWDDETGEVTGFYQFGFDGEDYEAWDMQTSTWVAVKQEAFITINRWNSDKAYLERSKNYLAHICPDWLKKYVNYGRSSLMKTDPPSVSLLQKTPSSPVSCHATGFYPNKAVMFWRKNGEELHEDVDQGEILPNHDGSFQKTIHLSSVKHEDWGNCDCVFQLSGLEDDIVTRLEKSKIKTNESSTPLIGIVIAAVVVLALVIGAVGFFIYRKKSAKRPPSPPPKQDPEVKEMLNPPPTV